MAKRRKSQAKRGNQRRIPVWAWFLGGILLGLGLSAVVLIRSREAPAPAPQPKPSLSAPVEAEKPKKPHYDFYALLRERETQVSDEELADKVKEESARPAAAEPAAPKPAAQERLLLQAGAFSDQRDAEAVKARIALAGLQSRVETVNINGTVMHRVRLGPYATASQLEEAKRQLAQNGVPDTLAVRERLD